MSDSGRRRLRWYAAGGVILGPLAVALTLLYGFDPVEWEGRRPLIHREDGFAGAATCESCHPDQFTTWARTFHRTMTQRARPDTVVGAFDGRSVRYQGKSARPFREGDRFYMELPAADGSRRVAEVALAVGSRRYQQYFEREQRGAGFVFLRLPILWHIGARRWLHLNTVFLGPDTPDWEQHRARWNENCIFCHNTAPQPWELDVLERPREETRFDSHVAQLGIACETCHGPGDQHVELYRSPWRRYAAYFREGDDTRIVHPEQLDKERAVSACGQCHGQRMPRDFDELARWLSSGPTFRSGERLAAHVVSVTRDTPSPAEDSPDLFRLRFWADGTPRLTAHEYQGVVMSPCYEKGPMTCGSCHVMHGGDPRGMIEPGMRGDPACTQCHAEIARDVRKHTFHDPKRSGSLCLECHMPRMVYGILEIHRSHRIENPDPRRDGEGGRPHACTACHVDKSLLWAADKMNEWWGEKYLRPRERADGAPLDMPDALASLLAGDAVQRAVYAWAAGWPEVPLEPQDKTFLRSALSVTLADAYPSVRWTAKRSLERLEQELPLGLGGTLAGWDHTDADGRTDFASSMLDDLARLGPARLKPSPTGLLLQEDGFTTDLQRVRALLDLQDDHVIMIGE